MSYMARFEASNKADLIVDISATDEAGADINFTGADVAFAIRDANRCEKITLTVGSGITLIDPLTLELHFTSDQMSTLFIGAYDIGGIMRLNGVTEQLLIGTLSVYDGIASL